MLSLRRLAIVTVLVLVAVPVASAQTSRQTLNLQGRLTDNTGACLTGPYAFQIDIFNVSSGGASLYSDTQAAVQVTNGIYDITIGAGTGGAIPTTVFSGCPDLWIEIKVNTETLSPRTHLTAVAYAYCANLLDGMDSTAFAPATGSANYAPASGSANYAPASGSANYAPTAGSASITTVGTITSGTWNGATIPLANGGTGTTAIASGVVPFSNGTALTGSSTKVFWDDTFSRLGIGTATPVRTLDVTGPEGSLSMDVTTAGYLVIRGDKAGGNFDINNGGAGGNLRLYADNLVQIRSPGGVNMTVTAAGDVGIGTATPAQKLDVNGNANITGNLTVTGTISGGGGFVQNGNSFGGLAMLGTNDANALALETGGTERMRILSTGNVGIGTTTPTSPLHVVGTAGAVAEFDAYGSAPIVKMRHANGTVAAPAAVATNDNLGTFSMSGYGTTGFGNPGKASLSGKAAENWTDAAQGAYLTLSTTPIGSTTSAERLRITDAGRVGIGATSPSGLLHLQNTGSNMQMWLTQSGSAAVYQEIVFGYNGGANYESALKNVYAGGLRVVASDGRYIAFDTAPSGVTERMRIDPNGNVGIGTPTPSWPLHVSRSQNSQTAAIVENGNAGASALTRMLLYNDVAFAGMSYGSSVHSTRPRSLIIANNDAAGDMRLATGGEGNERVIITSSGNVGIGTATPAQKLDVNGNTNISGNLVVTGTISQTAGGGDFVKKAGDTMTGILNVNAGFAAAGTGATNSFTIDTDSTAADTVFISTDGGAGDTIGIGSSSDVINIDTAGAGTSIQISNDGGGDNIDLGSPGDTLAIGATIQNANPFIFEGAPGGGTTTLTVGNPTVARTVTFPDADGTVALLDGAGNLKIPGGILEAGAAVLLQLRGDGNVDIHLDENNNDPNALWSVMDGANSSLMTAAEDGTIVLGLSGTASNINLGGNASDTINIGSNGAGGDTITLGGSQAGSSTSINTLTVGLGTTANGHTITIGATGGGSSTVLNADTVSIGTSANARTIGIGGTGSNAADTIDIGTGGGGDLITIGSDGDASAATINIRPGTAGTITLGNGAVADTINIGGVGGNHTVNVGTGTGTDNVNIATDASAETIAIGSTSDTLTFGPKPTWTDANASTGGGAATANGVVGRITVGGGDAAVTNFTIANSFVTANSHVYVVISSATAQSVQYVQPGAGSFVVQFTAALGAAATFDFFVIN